MKDLGTLVRIDFLLAGAGDRLTEAARHLSASDREQARAVLRSQQSALHQRIRACLEAAYGIRPDNDGCVGTAVAPEDRLVSLDGTFRAADARRRGHEGGGVGPARPLVRAPLPGSSGVRGRRFATPCSDACWSACRRRRRDPTSGV